MPLYVDKLSSKEITLDGNPVKPYKVYTAKFNQDGGNNPQSIQYPDLLVIGVTYTIFDSNNNTCDFTNVGAPNNYEGTSFVATGTIPNSWGYENNGVLTYNTGAPVVTILENTIGDIIWTYGDVGYYIGQLAGAFNNKTIAFLQLWGDDSVTPRTGTTDFDLNNCNMYIRNINGDPTNNSLNCKIEIRVYN